MWEGKTYRLRRHRLRLTARGQTRQARSISPLNLLVGAVVSSWLSRVRRPSSPGTPDMDDGSVRQTSPSDGIQMLSTV
jgi:hypothetical protein